MTDDPRHLSLCAERVAEFPAVASAEVTESQEYDRIIVSIALTPDEETVPPRITRRLIDHGLGIADVSPQGPHLIARAY